MKKFIYDTLLNEEDLCNLTREKKILLEGIAQKKKMIVYGVRNCGKTSLVKNVVIPHFQKKHKEAFVLFVDLMDVKTLESLQLRVQFAFEKAFVKYFPGKSFLRRVKEFLSGLRPQIEFDPASGQPTLTVSAEKKEMPPSLMDIFDVIKRNIAPQMPVLIVLDEFQDIAFIPEAQGLFRQAIQELKEIPVIFLGSKKHILSDLFAKPRAPLANTGEDLEFLPIPYEEYHAYILERLKPKKIKMSLELSTKLQDLLHRIPEPINIVCAHIQEHFEDCTLGEADIQKAISDVIDARSSRYQEYLSNFSEKEEELMIALAKQGVVLQPNSANFMNGLKISQRSVGMMIKKFLDKSIVERTPQGFRLSDPLLTHFLKTDR